ncbi:hypothetical protein [Dactylosporangium sp. NPDC000521]|uniref:hypothetical protein n=1 Tax=Dactylosporangium sp. NPDC000521 TaxID=3363975 RepID=UPI003688AFA7
MSVAARLAVAVMLGLATGACTGGDPDPAPTPDARPSAVTRRLPPGVQVDLTAVVTRVFGPAAFLVADADLPPDGQLVVSDAPVTVALTDLVRVSGRTALLDAAALRRYGAPDSPTGTAIVATEVRRYLPSGPT